MAKVKNLRVAMAKRQKAILAAAGIGIDSEVYRLAEGYAGPISKSAKDVGELARSIQKCIDGWLEEHL